MPCLRCPLLGQEPVNFVVPRRLRKDIAVKLISPSQWTAFLAAISLLMAPALGQSSFDGSAKKSSCKSSRLVSSTSRGVIDVTLGPSGTVTFTIVNSLGQKVPGQIVTISMRSTVVARAKSSVAGQVVISGLKPGAHLVRTGYSESVVRFWAPGSAPPQAVEKPAIVDQSDIIRGQYGYGYGPPMAPALLAATVTAVAIGAVVIAKSSDSNNSVSADSNPASP